MQVSRYRFEYVIMLFAVAIICRAAAAAEDEQADLLRAKEVEIEESDDELIKLQKHRYNSGVRELQVRIAYHEIGRADLDSVFAAAKRVRLAELALAANLEQKTKAHQKLLDLAKQLESRMEQLVKVGVVSIADLEVARYHRYDAEIGLVKAKRASQEER